MFQRAQIWAAGKLVSKIKSDIKFKEACTVQCSSFRTLKFCILLNVQSRVYRLTSRLKLISFSNVVDSGLLVFVLNHKSPVVVLSFHFKTLKLKEI